MPVFPGYSNPLISQFIEAGIFDRSQFSPLARLTWIWPFAPIHTAILNFLLVPWVVRIRRWFLWGYQPIIYKPLQSGEIRILKLHPGSLCSTIQCTVFHMPLFENTREAVRTTRITYQALSYACGPATPTAPILCNGHRLEVTKNLHEVLLYLRHRGIQYLWIDAICIDQSDDEEKSEQIQLIKQIYDRAASLVIWLGGGTRSSVEAFRLLDYMNQQVPLVLTKPSFNLNLLNNCSEESLDALARLLSRKWFTRVWMVQEVVTCKHRAMLYCGKTGRRWSQFMNGINILAHNGLLNSIPETHGRVQNVLEQLQLFENVEPYDMDLVKLVSLARSDESTNIRDKIYALLSLATDTTDLHVVVNKQHVPFEIDYTKSVREIYTDAAQAMIRSSGLQDILTQAQRREDSIHDLPTWVPDWSVTRAEFGIDKHAWRPNSMKIDYYGNEITHADGKYLKNFNAYRRDGCPDFREDGTLHVQGIHFDDLKGLSGTYPGSSSGGADLITWLEDCDQLAAQCLPDRTSGSKTEALWRTLIADEMGNIRPAPSTTEKEFWNFRLFLKRLQLPYDENLDEDLVYSVKDATPFTAEIGSRCKSRQFAITHGKYMCLVPDVAKIGDTVAIIDGCSIPTILRADQGQFRLIGDCYVHGIMYGENEAPTTRSLRRRKSCIRNEIRKFIIK